MLIRFDGRTAIVAGAARGIGQTIARSLANDGARVIACDLLVDDLAALAGPVGGGGEINVAKVDLHWTAGHGVSGQVAGMKVSISRAAPDQWNIETIGGTAQHGSLPALEVQQVRGAVAEKLITIYEATARVAGGGDIRLAGHISNLATAEMTADFSNLNTQ